MSRRLPPHVALVILIAAVALACGSARPAPRDAADLVPIDTFFQLFAKSQATFDRALTRIDDEWDDRYAVMLIEVARLLYPQDARRALAIFRLFEARTYITSDGDLNEMFGWVWERDAGVHPGYAAFKAALYRQIDPRFAAYFDDHTDTALVRLDEVRWGGVRRDGIPPLSNPAMIPASKASYLADGNVVFGVEINGDARAYPKRILAWHEMVKDTIGGVSVAGVYCTLCGSMIVYKTEHNGVHHELGTSGFLYRSNKLMYDHKTESLWSTLRGKPVIGPLVGDGIRLDPLQVVTTTWAEWTARHPRTTVLSLDTGHERDYSEGAAYRDYFATDDILFAVPDRDDRLRNKDEILALRFGPDTARPVAIASDFLAERPIYHARLGAIDYVILTDPSGAHRVYASRGVRFTGYDGRRSVTDHRGRAWTVTERAIVASDGAERKRLPAHRAFWFGWRAAYPDTVLIQ